MLLVVECKLLSSCDVPDSKEAQARKVWVQTVDPDIVDGHVWVARVVDEVGYVAVQGSVDRVGVVFAHVEVEIEQVRLPLGI